MKKIFFIVLVISLSAFISPTPELHSLIGKWKVENKAQYEEWVQTSDHVFTGLGYKLVDGNQVITEYLKIEVLPDKILYSATVPNQNEGETIPFILNVEVDSKLSFENPQHDFPTKIQYEKASEKELNVSVLGPDNRGFSYKLIKVEE